MSDSFRPRIAALVLWCCFSLSGVVGLRGDDWPQWRGVDRTGVSKETGLLKQWPNGGPKRLWMFREAGLGYSGFAVVGGMLFTMGARDGIESLLALDADSGSLLWSADLGPQLRNQWGDGPRGTPAVDCDRVFALSGGGVLVCVDTSEGKILWKKTMQDLGGKQPGWGYAESVLVDGGRVLCTPGGSKGAIAALDKLTGDVLWQSKNYTEAAQYASIVPADCAGKHQYIQVGLGNVVGVAADSGEVLWQAKWTGKVAVIPTPIYADGMVYVTSGYSAGCQLLKIDTGGTSTSLYQNAVMKNHHGGVVLCGGNIYGYSDGAGWMCQEMKTGKVLWTERAKLGKGALTCADGMLYCQDEASGNLVLVEASPLRWEERGRFRLAPQSAQRSPQGKIWTHPVVSSGRLYLRDQEVVFCYDVRKR